MLSVNRAVFSVTHQQMKYTLNYQKLKFLLPEQSTGPRSP